MWSDTTPLASPVPIVPTLSRWCPVGTTHLDHRGRPIRDPKAYGQSQRKKVDRRDRLVSEVLKRIVAILDNPSKCPRGRIPPIESSWVRLAEDGAVRGMPRNGECQSLIAAAVSLGIKTGELVVDRKSVV